MIKVLKRKLAVGLLAGRDTDAIMERSKVSCLRTFIYKMGSQFLIDYDFPLHLYLELSRTCNYNCPMCMRQEAAAGGHFPQELAEKIISEASRKGPTSYSLHLFGEPLANPKWSNIVSLIRSANPQNAILLTTNGFFMDEDCCKKLVELKVDRIFISIHSLEPQIYKKNTGGGDVSVVINNIRTFLRISGTKSKTKLFVRLFYGPNEPIPDKKSLSDLEDMGVRFEIRGYHNFAGKKNEWTTFNGKIERWPCFHPWFTLGIGVDGKATVCCADFSFGLDAGNAFNQSIEEIWNSAAVKSMRQEHLSNRLNKWTACVPCDTWQFHPDIFFNFQKQAK
jgi:MoaA/NifB/PqqE/SkfB family radical SAM enzyme